MNVLDYIIIALFVASTVYGLFKGLIKQALTIVGVIVVAMLTATVAPYVQSWLAGVIADENTRTVVAMIASVVLLVAAYSLLALIVQRLLKKVKVINVVDRLLGGLIGFAVVYFVFAVIFALLNDTAETFMPLLKGWLGDSFKNSWFATHIYSNNFFGHWIINGIAEKLINNLQPAA